MASRRSKIMANAERILEVLINNNAVAANPLIVGKIRELVNIEADDFDSADTYLLQARYVDGTMGGDHGTRSVTGAGIEFYETLGTEAPELSLQEQVPLIFAKLAGIYKTLESMLSKPGLYYDPSLVSNFGLMS
jgi:hypothetical protein